MLAVLMTATRRLASAAGVLSAIRRCRLRWHGADEYPVSRAAQLAKGNDPQLMRAIEEGMKLIKSQPRKIQPRPAYEDRTAQGIKD
jgi:hypothetical protein